MEVLDLGKELSLPAFEPLGTGERLAFRAAAMTARVEGCAVPSTIFMLLEREVSQRRIHELTGVDRKTIRRYQAIFESQRAAAANSSAVPAGPTEPVGAQTPPLQTPPPPFPPASDIAAPDKPFNFVRSASEPYRDWIEQQARLRRMLCATVNRSATSWVQMVDDALPKSAVVTGSVSVGRKGVKRGRHDPGLGIQPPGDFAQV